MPVQELRSSSAIDRAAYSPAKRELSIWFTGGRRYIYSDVPPELYDALCAARSAGRFVNDAVRGRFASRTDPPRRRYFD
ncbi:KTSC domain-containing protein [Altererythrobacter aerius]|uniref:KTSC domain-containing protein n=1 Tax=Tsuneonella aeria TaxID=1837929 RepID=A0A6I4TAW8_9SPHN|nr:KTSC domain-containing protein [Tsuneonella aeria]MXO73726.1 KTSC domain-containing protein [Tsuneonella aeria]